MRLEKPGTARQADLFDDTPPAEKSRLYAAVDALNARYGKGKVFSARHLPKSTFAPATVRPLMSRAKSRISLKPATLLSTSFAVVLSHGACRLSAFDG